MELNSGVFSVGMSVAPVIDWRYYDTMYTERYMKTPQMNPQGYKESAVVSMDGFRQIKFLLASGTADDNVHFHHAANLVWKLTGAGVTSYRVQYYTDSDHSLAENGAQSQVYLLLKRFVSVALSVSNVTLAL
jgi:dipeptidyl aminopeptidase/acylaminoacyl peptidase